MANHKKVYVEQSELSEQPSTERVYKQDIKIESDLFKLEVAKMKKDMVNNKDNPSLLEIEHCHTWRTFDSDGKPQPHCSPIGGHFHEIKYQEDENGAVKVMSVSGPMTWGVAKVKGKFKKTAVPIPDHLEDDHTHTATYIESHKLTARKQSPLAANIIASDAQKVAPVPGAF